MNEILTEAWKEAYEIYLNEEDKALNKDLDKLFEELEVAQSASKKSLEILKEYYDIMTLNEIEIGHDGAKEGGKTTGEKSRDEKKLESGGININIRNGKNDDDTVRFNEPKDLKDSLANLFMILNDGRPERGSVQTGKEMEYAPTAIFANQSVKDMRFPENIIFFIGQLIKWIKNVILFFVAKFINLIRRLTMSSERQIDVKFPGLDLTRPKVIDDNIKTVSLTDKPSKINLVKVGDKEIGILDRMLREGFILSEDCYTKENLEVLEEARSFTPGLFDDILKSKEDMSDLGGAAGKEMNFKGAYIVSIDFSKDIEDLKLLIQHFYDLFDNAYGSNSEKLFDTQDLEVVLDLIKNQFQRIKNGDAATTYTLGGSASQIEAVNVYKVKDNLILTNSNITALKKAYQETAAKIRNIGTVINGKEMLALSQYGVQYKVLTKSTLIAMKSILDTLPTRVKQAKKMEHGLIKMKRAYEKVIVKLEEAQRAVIGVSSIVFTSPYQRQVNDLISSTRFMSDIITLRLSGLGLYLKELQDTRDIIKMLTGINGKK